MKLKMVMIGLAVIVGLLFVGAGFVLDSPGLLWAGGGLPLVGMATTRNSVLYASQQVSKYIQDERDYGGIVRRIAFEHTVVSNETGGASANVQDIVNLCVLPAGCEVVALFVAGENVWASAAVNGTFQIGDSGDDDRYMLATELYTSTGGPLAVERTNNDVLAFTGVRYRPTSDTIVTGKYKVANPTVGKKIKGSFLVVLSH